MNVKANKLILQGVVYRVPLAVNFFEYDTDNRNISEVLNLDKDKKEELSKKTVGFFFSEKITFAKPISFAFIEIDRKYLLLNGQLYDVNEVKISCKKWFLLSSFRILVNEKIKLNRVFITPVWRDIFIDPILDIEDYYPLLQACKIFRDGWNVTPPEKNES